MIGFENQERKEQLKKMSFGQLQSTEEYKRFCDTYLNMWLVNEEVEYILKKSVEDREAPFSYEDIGLVFNEENAKYDTRNEILADEKIKDKDKLLKELETLETKEELNNFVIDNLISIDINDYEEKPEIFQWFFICDDRIVKQLESRGEIILNNKFWGRQCYGQSITMDGVIIRIFKEWYLELYGLPFEWAK